LKKLKFFFSTLILLATLFVAGCKSTPAANTVNALDLLDTKSGFYIAVPTQADPELLKRIIINNVEDISEKDVDSIIKRVNKIYCGLNRTKRNTEFQASIDANVPVNLVSKALTKKKGWNKTSYKTPIDSTYDIYNKDGVDVSVPSGKNICIGRDVYYMLDTYSELVLEPSDEHTLDAQVFAFLNGAEDEIRFYANKPQSFLTILTGTNLNLQLIDVWGAFAQDPDNENQYILDLDFNFKNEKFVKTGKALLTLAFGLTAKESSNNKNELIISGIQISKDSLYKLLVL